mgnify:FL=1
MYQAITLTKFKTNIMTSTQKQAILEILKAEELTAMSNFSLTTTASSDAGKKYQEMRELVKAFKAIDTNRL